MKTATRVTTPRIVWLDWLRVSACFMVMIVHATEPFYLGGEGARILSATDALWSSFFDSFVRSCVPLFVIASSYLLFPLHTSTSNFFRRRLTRIVVPFVIWSLVYALVWGKPADNLSALLLNFNYAAGHLWFVYMILGIYLIMPLLSPWAERVSKRELQFYLAVWLFTLMIPFIREAASGDAPCITYGPSGIPNPAYYPLWGEASWNSYGLFYYFSGFIGYLLLGLYLRRFVPSLSWKRTIAIALPAWSTGFIICFAGFIMRLGDTPSYPLEGTVDLAVAWEVPWGYDTVGIALMALGWILLFRKCGEPTLPAASPSVNSHTLISTISKASYGMYLTHMLILATAAAFYREWLGIGTDGIFGVWTTPVQIILIASTTFLTTAIVCPLVQPIPVVGKWLIG